MVGCDRDYTDQGGAIDQLHGRISALEMQVERLSPTLDVDKLVESLVFDMKNNNWFSVERDLKQLVMLLKR